MIFFSCAKKQLTDLQQAAQRHLEEAEEASQKYDHVIYEIEKYLTWLHETQVSVTQTEPVRLNSAEVTQAIQKQQVNNSNLIIVV